MSTFPLTLPDDLQRLAAAQAEASGVTLDQYITTMLAARVRAQADAERMFEIRAARAVPGRAREILARAGLNNPPRTGDELDADEST